MTAGSKGAPLIAGWRREPHRVLELIVVALVLKEPSGRMGAQIRAAEPTDAEALHALTADALDEPPAQSPLRWWKSQLERSGGPRWLVLEHAGAVIGCVSCRTRESSHGLPERGHVAVLAVHRQWRRQGYGTRLMHAAIDLLEVETPFPCISLFVRADNHAALQLYGRLGFQRHARVPGYYHGGDDAALLVRWRDAPVPAPAPVDAPARERARRTTLVA